MQCFLGVSATTLALMLVAPATAQASGAEASQVGDSPGATNNAASGQIQDIVVTAQRRSENLQKVPLAVVAFDAQALEARGITSVVNLGDTVPGLQIGVQKGQLQPFLRGIGATGASLSIEPKVAIYQDGIYYPRVPSSFFDVKNVERVEVLKGPQGTLFGRNSTGGVINIVTGDPSYKPSVSTSLGYGRFDAIDGSVYATSGITDNVAADISISGHTDDGYGKNITTGNRYNYYDNFLIRSKLLIEPSDKTRIVLSGFYSYSKQSGTKGGFPGTAISTISTPKQVYRTEDFGYYNAIDDRDNFDTFKIFGLSANIQAELPFAKLTSITSYVHDNEESVFEGDRTPRPDFYLTWDARLRQFTQEFQLASSGKGPLTWVAGLYYYRNKSSYPEVLFISPLQFGPGLLAPAEQKVNSIAGYGQATYAITDQLKFTGGLRYTVDKTTASGQVFLRTNPLTVISNLPEAKDTVKKVTFKAAVDYQVTDEVLVYALVSRGFKSGNFNILTYNSTVPTAPEQLDDYEAGFKTDLFDRRLRLNGSIFYYDIKNPQVQLLQNNTVFFSNAGAARVKGAELEVQAVLFPGFTARASATYLDSKYTKYTNAPSTIPDLVNGGALPGPNIDAKGNRTPFSPKFSFTLGGDYAFETAAGKVTITADLNHNSGIYFEPDNLLRQGAYDLVNAQVRLQVSENYAVRVFGKNLLDTKYANNGSSQIGPAGYPWSAAPPLTWGIAADFDF